MRPGTLLLALLVAQVIAYGIVTILSRQFGFQEPFGQRPILAVIGLLTVCFGLHLLSLKFALVLKNQRYVVAVVLVAGIAFRAILLFSEPIQEVDIYRYIWDGTVAAEGVNPFRYSPEQVLHASSTAQLPPDLGRLVALRDSSVPLAEVLARIHYGELTTVYPPVSQAVFSGPSQFASESTTVFQRVVMMKATLLLFDIATIVCVLILLRVTGRHLGWSIVYAWSPLVLKEFANSGHLDAIAVCFATASLACWSYGMQRNRTSQLCVWLGIAGLLLAVGTAAKLYPIVLLPLLFFITLKRVSWRASACYGASGIGATALLLAPMVLTQPAATTWDVAPKFAGAEISAQALALPHSTAPGFEAAKQRPRSGLATFLRHWEINDLIFMVTVENLRPTTQQIDSVNLGQSPWFAIVPNSWRQALVAPLSSRLHESPANGAFLLARGATLVVFVSVAFWLGLQAQRSAAVVKWLEASFLTLAWFWALSPTLNPWYWIWALPLLPFARGRAWFAVSGLLVMYYLRFWLSYHFASTELLGTGYRGENFFHFAVVPVEHGIWLVWLVIESWNWRKCAPLHRLELEADVL